MLIKFPINIIPLRIRKVIIRQDRRERLSFRAKQYDLPRKDLDKKHIDNLKVLKDRQKLLELLPKSAVVAEIGVDSGDFSKRIIDLTNPCKMHLIDSWGTERYNNIKKELVYSKFKDEIRTGKIEINVGNSIEVLKTFNDDYFDWIYIDTNHSYSTTKLELEISEKKIKEKGIISGHDYIMGNWVSGYKYGVIEAVHEFCLKYNWEIIFLTIEQTIPPSFAIRKISND